MIALHRRAAVWLLDSCCSESHRSVLVGDVLEKFAARQYPLAWLWKQVLAGVTLSIAADLRAHPQLTVRALFVGTLVLPLAQFGAAAVAGDVLLPVRSLGTGLLTACVLAHAVRGYRVAAVAAFATWYCLIAIPWTSIVAMRLPAAESLNHVAHQGSLIAMTVAGLAIAGTMSARWRRTPVRLS